MSIICDKKKVNNHTAKIVVIIINVARKLHKLQISFDYLPPLAQLAFNKIIFLLTFCVICKTVAFQTTLLTNFDDIQ